MQPMPKWVSYLAGVVAIASAYWVQSHPGAALPGWITAAAAIVAMFSHSVNGTGGK
jgi:hypothetical protein